MSEESEKRMEGILILNAHTKMVAELRLLDYEERLKALGQTTLELRRKRMSFTNIKNI